MKNLPLISFLTRYWLLITCDVLLIWLATSDRVFHAVGTFSYVPGLGLLAHLCALFGRHLFYTSTSDQDASDGTFAKEWRAVSPELRTILSVLIFASMFVGLCIIAASVGK